MEMAKYTAIACKVIEVEEVAVAAFEAADKERDAKWHEASEDFKLGLAEALHGMSDDEFVEWLDIANKDDGISSKLYHMVMMVYAKEHPAFQRKINQASFAALLDVLKEIVT